MSTTMPRVQLSVLRVGHCRHPECIAIAGGAWRMAEFPALVGLIRHPSAGAILFDTGYAEHFFAATARFPERLYRWVTPADLAPSECLAAQLAREGIALQEVSAVFVSHLHADHIAGLRDLPRARIWCADAALRWARSLGRLARLRQATLLELLPEDFGRRHAPIESAACAELPAAWRALGDGHDLLGDGSLWAVPLPGHARGHYGLLLRLPDDHELLLAGDASWGLRDGRLRSAAWPTRVLSDDWHLQRLTLQRLQSVLDCSNGSRMILPAHCAHSFANLPPSLRARA